MTDVSTLNAMMDVAVGDRPADLIVRGGRVVNFFTHEVEEVDVLVAGQRVAALVPPGSGEPGPQVVDIDAGGKYVTAGLIDSHFHMGGSHLPVSELAAALLARGTTAIATDFYEIYTVGGPEGVREALNQAAGTGLKTLFLAPVHLLGLEGYGTFGWDVKADDFLEMLEWPETVGIMEPPASVVLARQPDVLKVIAKNMELGKSFAGHAPGLVDRRMQAYLTVGASSDHESQTESEAVAKLRRGMRPMMRQGSAAPDLPALVGMINEYPESSRWMMLCSDEVDPGDLVRKGHMDEKVRMVVQAGVDPLTALGLASVNVAEYFGRSLELGAIAPGRRADMVLFEDLDEIRADTVIADGEVVAENGSSVSKGRPVQVSDRLRSTVNLRHPLTPDDFNVPANGVPDGEVGVRVIGVEDGSLVSLPLERNLHARDGLVQPSLTDDILRIAVVERHKGSGRISRSFVHGFGFELGAVAMTYCHVYHNLLVVGADADGMVLAGNELANLGGGIVVVRDGEVIARWSLPIVGVIGDQRLEEAQPAFDEVNNAIKSLGCKLSSPVLALSFVALPTIPAYGLTDRGLYDVEADSFVETVLGPGAS